jgi:hypothetical protein
MNASCPAMTTTGAIIIPHTANCMGIAFIAKDEAVRR